MAVEVSSNLEHIFETEPLWPEQVRIGQRLVVHNVMLDLQDMPISSKQTTGTVIRIFDRELIDRDASSPYVFHLISDSVEATQNGRLITSTPRLFIPGRSEGTFRHEVEDLDELSCDAFEASAARRLETYGPIIKVISERALFVMATEYTAFFPAET